MASKAQRNIKRQAKDMPKNIQSTQKPNKQKTTRTHKPNNKETTTNNTITMSVSKLIATVKIL